MIINIKKALNFESPLDAYKFAKQEIDTNGFIPCYEKYDLIKLKAFICDYQPELAYKWALNIQKAPCDYTRSIVTEIYHHNTSRLSLNYAKNIDKCASKATRGNPIYGAFGGAWEFEDALEYALSFDNNKINKDSFLFIWSYDYSAFHVRDYIKKVLKNDYTQIEKLFEDYFTKHKALPANSDYELSAELLRAVNTIKNCKFKNLAKIIK